MSQHHTLPGAVVHPVLPGTGLRPRLLAALAALLGAWLVVGSIL
ncbi:MAG: hypothetical protein R3290_07065 [Acidimicrobiia bacterium]|nr:hypothetical protein [Acidimicrobiia bacterium]